MKATAGFLAGLAMLVVACITSYDSQVQQLPRSLVVDGLITDQPGPHTIKLTYTADYTGTALNYLASGFTGFITDDRGRKYLLAEAGGGTYQTTDTSFRGEVGHAYVLHLTGPDGERYESAPERLGAVPPITDLTVEYTEYQDQVGLPALNKGFNVYLNVQDPDTAGNYYRWQWVHYGFTQRCGRASPCCTYCWDIVRCRNYCININSDALVNGKAISRQLILRAPYESTSKYYVEIEQQSLSLGAYQYFKALKSLINNAGGLFDSAPASITGNIRCITDAEREVYGYFGASGTVTTPLTIDRSTVPSRPNFIIPDPLTGDCVPCQESEIKTRRQPRWWTF